MVRSLFARCLRLNILAMVILCVSGRTVVATETTSDHARIEFFEKKIRPVLVEHCYRCHSVQSKQRGGLLLDSRAGLLAGGETGPAIVAGDVESSRLIKAVRYGGTLQMPPDGKLPDALIADLQAWIQMGAPDPRDSPVDTPTKESTDHLDIENARNSWAYQAPRRPAVPAVGDCSWPRNQIDHFILAKLEAKDLEPAPEADKRTLIRRVYFDLIGLPPTAAEVDAFLADTSSEAYEKIIDKLLSSPLYGQRWARHWLDVVRYTDSFDSRIVGNEFDIAFAWRYRDWVVNSFNEDLPYDRFVKEQIAGDLISSRDGRGFNREGIVATGVYMIGEWGGGDADKEKLISDIVDDQIDLTGRAFMGLTLACARCHDHKFDPISTEDYYGLAGIFYSSHILSDVGPKGGSPVNVRAPLLSPQDLAQRKADKARLASLEAEIESTLDAELGKRAVAMVSLADEYLSAAWQYENYTGGAERPTLDEFALQLGLRRYELGQWVKLLTAPALNLLNTPADNLNVPGLFGWRNGDKADAPIVVVNASDQAASTLPGLTFPARSVNLHPGPTSGVAVSWKSPIAGRVLISGKVTDGHAVCGDGIAWSVSASGGASPGEIASGTIANGGSQTLAEGTGGANLASVEVVAGEMIQLAILPKVEYSCDTTHVELEITELATRRVWNVASDAVASPHATNPLQDPSGEASTWHFHDLAKSTDLVFASGSPLSRFVAVMNQASSAGALQAAAGDVAESLRAVVGQEQATLSTPDAAVYRLLTSPAGPFWSAARSDESALDADIRSAVADKRAEAASLRKAVAAPIPVAHALQEGGTPRSLFPGIQDVPVHIRGRYDRLGDVVPRHFPTVIAGDDQPPITEGSGRKQLAEWIASPEHPLTARVMVNRIWQHHFGEGIVRTPNNFGKLGAPPTHPQLLDQLAIEFIESGWSIKSMHRQIMLSAAYRQSSRASDEMLQADPENLLIGRMNRRAIEAEALRDALLFIAGRLDTSLGGVAINDLNTPRRTLYVMTIRSLRANFRTLFDAADASAIVEQRIHSIVAPQALFMMNHPFALAQAKALAERAMHEGGAEDAAKIDWLYRTLYARPPSQEELQIGIRFVSDAPWVAYCQVLLCANEFMYVD